MDSLINSLLTGPEYIRGLKVQDIGIEFKKAHDSLISRIRKYDPKFRPTKIYSWYDNSNWPSLGLGIIRYKEGVGQVILVNSKVTPTNTELEEYKRFLFVNSPNSDWNIMKSTNPPSTLDFFNQLVSHEYAHLMEEKRGIEGKGLCNEAFAFWFIEVMTGFTSLFLSFRNHYNNLGLDFNKMEDVYDKLHSLSKTKGIEYTLNNAHQVVDVH